jgi:hypothetical protein
MDDDPTTVGATELTRLDRFRPWFDRAAALVAGVDRPAPVRCEAR